MILLILLLIPLLGIFFILADTSKASASVQIISSGQEKDFSSDEVSLHNQLFNLKVTRIKFTALSASIFNLFVSLIIFILFDFSSNQFQFVQEYHEVSDFHIYLGVDGISIYFVLLTTIITPIALLSN
jgi:hypothetical protein